MFVKHHYSKYWQENNNHAVYSFFWGGGLFISFDLNRTFHRKSTRCPPTVLYEDP